MHCKSCHCNSCPLLVPAFGSCFNPPDSDGLQDATKNVFIVKFACMVSPQSSIVRNEQLSEWYRTWKNSTPNMLGRRYVHCIIRIYFKRTWCWSISGSCGIRKCIKQTTNYQELRLLGINLHVWKANQLPKTDIASLRRASTWAWNPQKWRWEHHFSVNDILGKLIVYLFGFWKTDLGIYIYILYIYIYTICLHQL